MSYLIEHFSKKSRVEYHGTGPAIRAMDHFDALACLQLDMLGDDAASHLMKRALRVVVDYYGVEIMDFDDHEGIAPVERSDLAWALSRARSGDVADAAIHLSRAFAYYPEAVAALDIIARHLNTRNP
jgi:hypothetical protein